MKPIEEHNGRPTCSTVAQRPLGRRLLLLALPMGLAGCTNLPTSGPSAKEVREGARPTASGGPRFALVDLDAAVVSKMEKWTTTSLRGTFGQQRPAPAQTIGVGDYVEVVIWEASSGGLFTAPPLDKSGTGARSAAIPAQVVGRDGAITVPFAGRVRVAGRSPQQVEEAIVSALQGKAIEPQALVTVTKNIANTVTVIGEVTGGARVPLTTRGDRILDVVATAGGIKVAAHEAFVTLNRDGQSVRIPLQAIINDPGENVFVRPGDVISVARELQTFTAAGATGQNAVVPFDAIGITLDQAIARAGGLNDFRADPTGVYVIRYERSSDYDQLALQRPDSDLQKEVPVIYQVNMRDPNSFFLARRFPIHNKDILFVSNASATDLQKIVSILLPILGAGAGVVAVGAAVR